MALDIDGLGAYVRDVRRAARVGREAPAADGSLEVDADQVWWRRLAVTHAVARLPAGHHADAAYGGLQDSDPRSALLSLHARVADVDPSGWEHPSLVQVWLRAADYVVPRRDVGVFTLGTQSRDPRYRAALEQLADVVVAAVPDGRRDSRAVFGDLATLRNPALVKATPATGRVHIRWDARKTEIVVAERPAMDPEEARLELARRFLHWLGPARPAHFARWAGVTRVDAEATWGSLASEIEPVSFQGKARWMLAKDTDDLAGAERPRGVRLLPAGDPCLSMGGDRPTAPGPRRPDEVAGVTSRVLNSLTGRVVMDGAIVGAWGRVKARVTIDPWPSLPESRTDDVAAEARSFERPIGAPIDVRWLPCQS
jgi:winged helix DNA-binding protein